MTRNTPWRKQFLTKTIAPCGKCGKFEPGCRKDCEKWKAFEEQKRKTYEENAQRVLSEYDKSRAFEYVRNRDYYRLKRKQ